MTNCDTCGARIRWVKTTLGKRMPLDDLPVADGNVVLWEEQGKGVVARVLSKGEQVDALTARFKSHFATCPDAAKHRRR